MIYILEWLCVVCSVYILCVNFVQYFVQNLRGVHFVWGEPIYPFGQVHTGLWFTTLHSALGAQGLSTAHGLMHFRFLQDV